MGTVSVFTFGGSTRLRAAFVFPPLGRVGLIGVAKTLSGDGWAARDEEEEGGERARTSPCRRIRLRRAWLRISPSWGLGEYDASRCWFGADIVSFPLQGFWCAVDETVTRGGVHPRGGCEMIPAYAGLYTNHIV